MNNQNKCEGQDVKTEKKKGFFSRLIEKIDKKLEDKANTSSSCCGDSNSGSSCCGGSDDKKGNNSCC